MNIYFDEETLDLLRKHLEGVQRLTFNGYINPYEVAHLLKKSVIKMESLQMRLNNAHKMERKYEEMLEETISMIRKGS